MDTGVPFDTSFHAFLDDRLTHKQSAHWNRVSKSLLRLLRIHHATIVPADKNMGLVCVLTDTYDSMNKTALTGFHQYSSTGIETTMKSVLHHFPDATRQYPRFYGIIKLHKTPVKCRPIVSFKNCVLSPLDKHVFRLLQKLWTTCKVLHPESFISILGSQDAIDRIKKTRATDLRSGDVTELYTRLRHADIRMAIKSFASSTALPEKDELLKYLSVLLNHLLFTYDGTLYKQSVGIPMGAICGPILANLTLAYLENSIAGLASKAIRFLDDLLVFDTNTFVELKRAYSKFALDLVETTTSPGNTIFLDMKLSLHENRIKSDLYEKANKANTYLHWHSANPRGHYRGIVFGFIHRLLRICDSEQDRKRHLSVFVKRLQQQKWPPKVIHSLVEQALNGSKAAQHGPLRENPDRPVVAPFSLVRKKEALKPLFWSLRHLDAPLRRAVPLSRFATKRQSKRQVQFEVS